MSKVKIHIDENLPDNETINKYKNYSYKQINSTKWYRYQHLKHIFKNKKMLAIIIMVLVTILIFVFN